MRRALCLGLVLAVAASGLLAYRLWASGCCGAGACLCHGAVSNVVDTCDYEFTVDHSRDCGTDHDVYVYVKEVGEENYTAFLMTLTSLYPYPVCMQYYKKLTLDENTYYYYYFGCPECDETCCGGGFNTGDCGS